MLMSLDPTVKADGDVVLVVRSLGSVTKGKAADAKWKSIFAAKSHPNFYYDWIKGVDSDTVVVSGGLYLSGDDDGKDQIAPVQMRWEKSSDQFSLDAIKIGPYKAYTPASE